MGKERQYTHRLCCSKKVKDMILNHCIQSYLTAHPEMQEIKITHQKILYEIAKFYLKW